MRRINTNCRAKQRSRTADLYQNTCQCLMSKCCRKQCRTKLNNTQRHRLHRQSLKRSNRRTLGTFTNKNTSRLRLRSQRQATISPLWNRAVPKDAKYLLRPWQRAAQECNSKPNWQVNFCHKWNSSNKRTSKRTRNLNLEMLSSRVKWLPRLGSLLQKASSNLVALS